MIASSHEPADSGKELEVPLLTGAHRVTLEMRDHSIDQVVDASHLELDRLVAPIRANRPASEVILDIQEHFSAVRVLADGKARPHSHPRRILLRFENETVK